MPKKDTYIHIMNKMEENECQALDLYLQLM